MDEFAETVWRQALKAKGKDWVKAELQRRPGYPQDVVYDVVFEEPFPTRDFCQQWCAEEDSKLFHVSWHTFAVLAAFIVTVCCCAAAVSALSSYHAHTPAAALAGAPAPRAMRSEPPDNEPNSTGAHFAGESEHHLPGICAYETSYQSDVCKPQN
jgi:hypothetical protein